MVSEPVPAVVGTAKTGGVFFSHFKQTLKLSHRFSRSGRHGGDPLGAVHWRTASESDYGLTAIVIVNPDAGLYVLICGIRVRTVVDYVRGTQFIHHFEHII